MWAKLNTSVRKFDELGYLVIPNLLSKQEAASLFNAFEELPLIESAAAAGWRRQASERALVRNGQFLSLLRNVNLIDVMRQIIGDDLQLLDYEAMEISPLSGKKRDWHSDFHFPCKSIVLTANVAIYLQDMIDDVGPLHIIPCSHTWGREPTPDEVGQQHPDEIKVAVPAGTGVVFTANLWHTGSRNNTTRPRRALFPYFGHYWIKRMDEFYRTPLPPAITQSSDPLLRQLFGLGLAVTSVWGPGYNPNSPTRNE